MTPLQRVSQVVLGEGKTSRMLRLFLVVALFSFTISLFALFTMKTFFPATSAMSESWLAPDDTPPPQTDTNSKLSIDNGVAVSDKLVRIAQMDRSQYDSDDEYNTWAASACSATSMTEVINAYGHNYRITDILKVESSIDEISPDLGLLEPQGIAKTVDKFGFKTISFSNSSLDSLISIGNQGRPIIVGFPPYKWTGGHLLVLKGGDDDSVFLADSSQFNMKTISRQKFLSYWGGFAEVVMPKDM
jgi:hypothetical protein